MVDLTALFILLAALLTNGPPDQVGWSASVGLVASYGPGGMSGAVVIGLDPTPIRYRPAAWPWPWGENTCGLTDGYNVWVYPHPPCVDTLEHEMVHVRQRQALGWLGKEVLMAAGLDLEAAPRWTASEMMEPSGLNFPLLRIAIPVRWGRTP